MRVDEYGRIVEFVEKPTDPAVLDSLALDEATLRGLGIRAEPGMLLASMGMYVFRDPRAWPSSCSGTTAPDFGRDVIPVGDPGLPGVSPIRYNGYWSDIGTIPHFHQANLELARAGAAARSLRSGAADLHPRPFPARAPRSHNCRVNFSILCEGIDPLGRRGQRVDRRHPRPGARRLGDRAQRGDGRQHLRRVRR